MLSETKLKLNSATSITEPVAISLQTVSGFLVAATPFQQRGKEQECLGMQITHRESDRG